MVLDGEAKSQKREQLMQSYKRTQKKCVTCEHKPTKSLEIEYPV